MSTIALKGGRFLSPDGGFSQGDILLEDAHIRSVGNSSTADTELDCSNLYVLPGFIDIHTHGALGYDCMKATPAQLAEWSAFLASHGVTSFMPTTVSAPVDEVLAMLDQVKAAADLPDLGAKIVGVHVEGPYISTHQLGCHEASFVRKLDKDDLIEFERKLGDDLKLRVTVAPEAEGAMEFIRLVKEAGGYIAIGHTDATLDVTYEAIKNGADSFTHLFNGMRGIHHREPGTAGAALLSDAYAEIIADGIHLHPEIIKLTVRAKGIDKIIAVTDAMQATGLSDGEYPFGGKTVYVRDGVARIKEGNLAGSTLTLDNSVRNIARFADIPFEEAVRAVTINPARAIGIDGQTGTIEPGKYADFAIVNDKHEVVYTISRGKVVYKK